MKSSNRLIVAMLIVAALAAGFWILILSPKREEADELSAEVSQMQSQLALTESQVAEGTAAKREFPKNYRTVVVLGKAVPGDDETSSLLVELDRVARRVGVEFQGIQLGAATGEAATPTASAPEAGPSSAVTETLPPTEAAASLSPLGASIGPAGLSVMPYDLTFTGSFFHVSDFIRELDSMVETGKNGTEVKGRLITIDGFALTENSERGFPMLSAHFSVTTYLTPPGQGVTAGATAAAPAAATAPEASTTTPSAQ